MLLPSAGLALRQHVGVEKLVSVCVHACERGGGERNALQKLGEQSGHYCFLFPSLAVLFTDSFYVICKKRERVKKESEKILLNMQCLRAGERVCTFEEN